MGRAVKAMAEAGTRCDVQVLLPRRYPVTRVHGGPNQVNAAKHMSSLKQLERAKGFEPSTSTLARLRSTPELRPHRVPPGWAADPVEAGLLS